MANIFKKRDHSKKPKSNRPFKPREHQRRVSDHDLVDPIAYVGDLDLAKYPILEQKKTETQEFEPENPLNKR